MHNPDLPPHSSRRGNTATDLDGLLTSFFQHEMPRQWPDAPLTEVEQPHVLPMTTDSTARAPRRTSHAQWHSRLALAASVAIILLGSWLLLDQGGTSTKPNVTGIPTLQDPGASKFQGSKKINILEESLELQPGKKDKPRTNYKMILEELP